MASFPMFVKPFGYCPGNNCFSDTRIGRSEARICAGFRGGLEEGFSDTGKKSEPFFRKTAPYIERKEIIEHERNDSLPSSCGVDRNLHFRPR